jgi:hypothetical protein
MTVGEPESVDMSRTDRLSSVDVGERRGDIVDVRWVKSDE